MKELTRFRQFLNEGAFGDDKKAALENSLTGMAKDMVEDGTLFAEGGNVTYDEAELKDGATPEQSKENEFYIQQQKDGVQCALYNRYISTNRNTISTKSDCTIRNKNNYNIFIFYAMT